MIQNEILPKVLTVDQVAQVLHMNVYAVRTLVTTRAIQSSSYEEIPAASLGKYLEEVKGLTAGDAEMLIASTLYPDGYA